MSAYTKNSPIFDSNTNEAILASNEQSYDDLIGYCALRKQFARIIPSYYTEIQKQSNKNKKQNISSIEEYKKLKEEINNIQESIESLKESKQKKLKQIEELRILMRKVGNKQISYKGKEQKQINNNNNNIINNYYTREKSDRKRKGSNCFKVSSDEGLSLATTNSGLSSGKDDEAGAEGEEGGVQQYPSESSNNSYNLPNSSSCCFRDDRWNNRDLMLRISENDTTTLCENN